MFHRSEKAATGEKTSSQNKGERRHGQKHSASLPSQSSGFTGFTHSQARPPASNYREITSGGFQRAAARRPPLLSSALTSPVPGKGKEINK